MINIHFIQKFIDTCNKGYNKGWHERNGGNLSYRLSKKEVNTVKHLFDFKNEWIEIGVKLGNLANQYFMITASGSYFSNIKKNPLDNLGIIEVSSDGTKYKKVYGFNKSSNPTSELPTHLMNHSEKIKSNEKSKVIYHAHATNLIALTFILPLNNNLFTRLLWEMSTECSVVFPNGIGIIPWMVPGSLDIGRESSKIINNYDIIIWAHHGVFCSGKDLDEAFGLMETVEKSAEIFIKILSTGKKIRQSIKTQEFVKLGKAFNIDISEEFLLNVNKEEYYE